MRGRNVVLAPTPHRKQTPKKKYTQSIKKKIWKDYEVSEKERS